MSRFTITKLIITLSIHLSVTCRNISRSNNILIINQFPLVSHNEVYSSAVHHLLKAGHSVTYITPTAIRSNNTNLTQLVYKLDDAVISSGRIKIVNWHREPLLSVSDYLHQSVQVTAKVLKSSVVQNLLTRNGTRFDAVVAVWDYNELVAGVAAIFHCPIVWLSLHEPSKMSFDLIKHSDNTQIFSDVIHKETLTDDLKLLMNSFKINILFTESKVKGIKLYREIYESAAERLGVKVPHYSRVTNNASMVLFGTHPAVGRNHAMPPNAKYFGGAHVESDYSQLKKDLKNILEKSKNGVILCNLGRDIDSQTLPKEAIDDILKVFGELRQTVIWKFDRLPANVPKNVYIRKSLPHAEVLAHANTKMFINNAEIASLNEALYFGIPAIAVPMYLDHFYNANLMVKKGYGLHVKWERNLGPHLKKAIGDLLHDPSYTVKAHKLSDIYHDRYFNPGEEISEWIAFVARTKGAEHLRSSGSMMPWYQNLYVDNLIMMLIFGFVLLFCLYHLCTKCCRKRQKNHHMRLD